MTISVKCKSCGKTLRAKDTAAGKKAKCPACGETIQVPKVLDAEEAAPAAEEEDDWGFGSFDELASMERSARSLPGEKRRPCPMCGEMIVSTAAKCRHCGEIFDATLKRKEQKKKRSRSRSYSSDDDDGMTAVDWVLCVLCPGIACIVGLVRVIQGRSSGGMMMGVAIGMAVFWNVVNVIVQMAIDGPGGP